MPGVGLYDTSCTLSVPVEGVEGLLRGDWSTAAHSRIQMVMSLEVYEEEIEDIFT